MDKILKAFEWLAYYATGEFVLKNRPNSGSIIIFRSLWVSIILFICAITLSEITNKKTIFPFQFSLNELATAIHEKLEWFAAFIGFSYLALYSRFASQWSYLADLYNRIMQSRADNADSNSLYTYDEKKKLSKLSQREQIYAYWLAGFIHDARDLHLSDKDSYKSVIESMLKLPGVSEALGEHDCSDSDSCESKSS